jgi:muramoyltetrapeptide carboxypeptidase
MVKPEFLKAGDSVGIVSPSGRIDIKHIDNAVHHLSDWGLKVKVGNYAANQFGQFAGKDKDRSKDLQEMIDDESINAIFCARGGYGALRTVQNIDFRSLKRTPKWLIGYSDITVLHQIINHELELATIHGSMPINFPQYPDTDYSVEMLKSCLFSETLEYDIETTKYCISGITQGVLVGGNLSILYSLRGTPYDYDLAGKILFIEDVGEYLYHIDRILMNFMSGGKLDQLKGIIVGGFSEIKDSRISFGKDIYEILSEFFNELNIPVLFDFPAGHIRNNMPLIFGQEINLNIQKENAIISYI